MLRTFTIIALIGLLAACGAQGDGDTIDTSMDSAPSVAASASAEAGSSAGATGTASAACADAFAAVAEQDVESLSAMGDLPEVEATIEQCESITDWTAGAATVIGEVNPSTAALLLEIRCQLPALGSTAVCEEVAAS